MLVLAMGQDITNKEKELKASAIIIEATLATFGLQVRVCEVREFEDYIEFYLEVALGTSVHEILKLDKDIAIALASPTGNVEIQAPIPGTSLIGIKLPKNSKTNIPKKENALFKISLSSEPRLFTNSSSEWRRKTSNLLYTLSYIFEKLGEKVSKKKSFV